MRWDSQTVRKNLERIKGRWPNKLKAAFRAELEIELTEVKRRTPVDKGPLRASEHIEGPEYKDGTLTAAIVAGGPAAPYAEIVHEDPDAIHPVGQWKYIESVIDESAPHFPRRLAKRLDFDHGLL